MATVLSSSGETLVVDWLDHRGWQSRRAEFRGGVMLRDHGAADRPRTLVDGDGRVGRVRHSTVEAHPHDRCGSLAAVVLVTSPPFWPLDTVLIPERTDDDPAPA
jgi:hypothetical protein